jgi:histidine triad (HIT) family protein
MNEPEKNCLFCKIVAGKIPSLKVYENDKFLAFLDIHPVSSGHTLLIPKAHYPWMHETPDDLVGEVFITAKKLMNAIKDGLPCDYVQVTIVGKDVPHLHIHLMPRYFNDTLPMWSTTSYNSEEEKQNYVSKIKSAL